MISISAYFPVTATFRCESPKYLESYVQKYVYSHPKCLVTRWEVSSGNFLLLHSHGDFSQPKKELPHLHGCMVKTKGKGRKTKFHCAWNKRRRFATPRYCLKHLYALHALSMERNPWQAQGSFSKYRGHAASWWAILLHIRRPGKGVIAPMAFG